MKYETVIGLEVHAQLLTRAKLFCPCPTTFGARQNTNTCPVCFGLPGALPVLNRRAVDLAIIAGLALNCAIQSESVWERKNYFYQDLPKGYQITQYQKPLCLKGELDLHGNGTVKRVGLTRIHMEEDAGKSLHDTHSDEFSRVDLNRAGVPLVEIVSEPDMRSPAEAGEYLSSMRSILRYAGVCDGNMEEGSLRCDANVSLRPVGAEKFGVKVELKNINSVKFLEKAITYEIARQSALLDSGQNIVQETRLYDSATNTTASMRSKEDAHDYRYFPDPDLTPLIVDKNWIERCRRDLPELPTAKSSRFVEHYNIPAYDAGVLTADKSTADYFERAVKSHDNPKRISNWIMSELLRELKKDDRDIAQCPVTPEHLAKLVALIDGNTISGKIAKTVFEEMYRSGADPEIVIRASHLALVSDTGAIEAIIADVIKANRQQHEQYKRGKEKLFGFFVGQVMQAMKGQADPAVVNELLKKKL